LEKPHFITRMLLSFHNPYEYKSQIDSLNLYTYGGEMLYFISLEASLNRTYQLIIFVKDKAVKL